MTTEFTVQVQHRSVANIVVEADSEEEAVRLVSDITEREIAELFNHEQTVHDRYVCSIRSVDYERTQHVVEPDPDDDI